MSSMSAMRGLPKHLSTYAASKAAVAHLAEGIRAELLDTPPKSQPFSQVTSELK